MHGQVCVGVAYQDTGCTIGQRAIRDVRVSSDPADVSRAPVDVVMLVVEHQLEGGGSVEHVAAYCVQHPLQAGIEEQLEWHEQRQKTSYSGDKSRYCSFKRV